MNECYVPETSSAHIASVAPWLPADKFEAALIDVHDRGYVIIEDVLSPSDCETIVRFSSTSWRYRQRGEMYLKARAVIDFMPC